MDLIHQIESLRHDIENSLETDVIKISIRLIQMKDQAIQLLKSNTECMELKLGQMVYHKDIYWGREQMKVVGLREKEVELEGDYSGGTNNVCQKDWMPKEGVLFSKEDMERIESRLLGHKRIWNSEICYYLIIEGYKGHGVIDVGGTYKFVLTYISLAELNEREFVCLEKWCEQKSIPFIYSETFQDISEKIKKFNRFILDK